MMSNSNLSKTVQAKFRLNGIEISNEAISNIVDLSFSLSKISVVRYGYFLDKLIERVSEIQLEYESDCVNGRI